MQKVILTKGLPGSGKTTWAKEQVQISNGFTVVVCKDDIREMLNNSIHSKGREAFVLKIRDLIILESLKEGKSVIVADTNLNPIHETEIRKLVADFNSSIPVLIQDFTCLPIEVCIEQDLKRVKSVGEKVIRKMYNDWLKPKTEVPQVEFNPELENCFIIDIDGTIAKMNGRSPYDWNRVDEDLPNSPVLNIINALMLARETNRFIFMSGRDGSCWDKTASWLNDHICAVPSENTKLLMRSPGDTRKDSIVKLELYERYVKPRYNVLAVFDDRDQVVQMWREQGLTCLQVAEGNF